ncbi:phage tail tip fiber protein [Yersinia artesiana]|uniref:phage tail tip fiber protein n=1 Tax=Yersinia artesiana TaxID=2890315 RepID=UPI0015826BAF|nr:DUF1983 domain-containing protein [Yersinia artesiana]
MTKGYRAGRDAAALTENIEILTGQRGDGRGQAVTREELAQLKLATLRAGGGGRFQLKPHHYTETGPVPAFPIRPQHFSAQGGFSVVLLLWEMPAYRGHAHTEIYRNTEDNLANAVLVGTSAAAMYSDPVDPGWKGYYWVRFVNASGIPGPFSGTGGAAAATQPHVDEMINLIHAEIHQSPLIGQITDTMGSLGDKVDHLDQQGGEAFQAMWSTKAHASGVTAGIGLVAGKDAYGRPISQVAIAADRLFVFDPNKPGDTGRYAIPFSMSGGKVVIADAVIRDAIIKFLKAETIVADEVKAGISLSTPILNSAIINNGHFSVDAAGNVKIGDLITISSTGRITFRLGSRNIGLVITHERIDIYDENGVLMARFGKLDD